MQCFEVIGWIHYSKAEYQEAIGFYSKAINIIDEARDYIARGDAYRAEGNVKLAIADYRAAQEQMRKYHFEDEDLNEALRQRLDWVQKSE